MTRSPIIREYLREVKRELLGTESQKIIEEISGHIEEKASDISVGSTTEDDYRRILIELGSPEEVIRPYLKDMPLKLPWTIKIFLILQILVGVAAFVVFLEGMDAIFRVMDETPFDRGFFFLQILTNVFFLLISILSVSLAIFQWRKPFKVASFGNLGAVISLSIVVGIIFVMFRIIMWGMWGIEYDDESYYPLAGLVMVIFVTVFLFGFQQMERFQRRIYFSEEHAWKLRKDRKRTNGFLISIASVFIILLVSVAIGQSYYSEDYYTGDELLAEEIVGGPYDAKLQHWETHSKDMWYDYYRIVYEKNGTEYDSWFGPEMRRSLDWLKENGEEGSIVLSWWDYGHPIRGYTGLDVIIDRPHRSMKNTVADPSKVTEWEKDEERISDVASALVTTDVNETIRIMEDHNASYILTTQRDGSGIFYALLQSGGLDPEKYFLPDPNGFYEGQTELGRSTVVNTMWRGEDIKCLDLVYSDIDVRIYKISQDS